MAQENTKELRTPEWVEFVLSYVKDHGRLRRKA